MELTALPGSFRGELIRPGDPSYDEHRKVWNGSIDRSPTAIARCASTQEVVDAVGLARESGLRTAVRGGGHSFPGHSTCDDGIVIDLSKMKGSRSIRTGGPLGSRRAYCSESWMRRRRSTALRFPRGSSPTPAWPG